MKTLLKTTLIAATIASLNANAAISVGDTTSAVFNFGGTIEKKCKVKSTTTGVQALTLDENSGAQSIGTLDVWCNMTGSNVITTYSSANGGKLKDGNNTIGYTLAVGGIESGIELDQDYSVGGTTAGTGRTGTSTAHILTINPETNGLDTAGDYSDTITVTVSFN